MAKQGNLLSKTLVIGIIILFVVMSTFPTVSNSIRNNTVISLITVKVAGEMGLNDWYVSDVGFTFSNGSSDIAEIKYGIDGIWQTYTEPFYISDDGKDIHLEWFAIDSEGNQSDVDGPFLFNIDQTPPEIELSYEGFGVNHWWQAYDILITAHVTDEMSGMERVEFYLNDVLQKTVTGSGPVYQWQFKYHGVLNIYVTAKAFDKAGNSDFRYTFNYISIAKERSIDGCLDDALSSETVERKNDIVNKESTLDVLNKEVFDPAYVIVVLNREIGENGWIVSNVSIPIYYESDRIDEVYYQINEEGWLLYSEPLVISEDGEHCFSWYVVDSEGYISTPDSISFKVDRTPPEIILKRKRIALDKIKYTAYVYDETSNIDRVEFYEPPNSYKPDFTDKEYPFEWIKPKLIIDLVSATVYDNAGNSASKFILFNPIQKSQQPIYQQFSNSLFLRLFDRFPLLEVFLRAMNLLR
jgi:hypothetical protein